VPFPVTCARFASAIVHVLRVGVDSPTRLVSMVQDSAVDSTVRHEAQSPERRTTATIRSAESTGRPLTT